MSSQISTKPPRSKTHQLFEGSGQVKGSDDMSAPARWVAMLVQRLVALMLVAMGTALQAIFTGNKQKRQRERR
jgi:hypothetical protein